MDYYNQGEPVEIFKAHFSDISDGSQTVTQLVRISGNNQAVAIGYNSGGYGGYLIFGYAVGLKLLILYNNSWEETSIVQASHN